ncbi:MAG: hypothetical protein JXA49_02275 [Actinobacteria bacterium]|nr:hypothetical protein [Actinomycetota bacterium]
MFLIHPLVIAIVPVLFLYSSNLDEAPFSDLLLPAGLTLMATLLLLVVFRLILKDWEASAFIVSITLVLFYSYGRLVEALGGSIAVQVIVALIYVALLVFLSRLTIKSRGNLRKPTAILNVMAATLLILISVNILMSSSKKETKPGTAESDIIRAAAADKKTGSSSSDQPDIYYIILDGYGSNTSLMKYYGYDNSEFTSFLEDRGFYVADNSRSNYTQTRLSLASSLNLEHIDFMTDELGRNSRRSALPNAMIENNGLARFLKSRGYDFVFFGSNWSGTKSNTEADLSYTEGNLWNTEFMVALMKTTALRGLFTREEGLYSRDGVLRAFEKIPEVSGGFEAPVFVFAHIIPPHRPFLFDRNGKPTSGDNVNSWENKDGYIDQLIFVNKKAGELVDSILENSEKPPVIVIQADHGPMPPGDPEILNDPTPEAADLRTGILNAYYMPGSDDLFYETITPVNSFRLILGRLFGLDLDRLDDTFRCSSYKKPYDFKDVTDMVNETSQP